jgi:glutathione transport system substrate-binding protein
VHRGLAASSTFRAVVREVAACGAWDICFFLKAPFAALPSLWTITPIVSPRADLQGHLDKHAVGTGPYRFVDWKTGEYVLEERNLNYWGPAPPLKRIRWLWSTESALMNMALLAREVDLVSPLPPVFAEALGHSRRVKLIQGKSSAVFWVALNTKLRPLDDVRVRRALNYAVDRDALIRSQLRGYALPANSPLAPADFAYSAATRGYHYDPGKARSLLAEAGVPHGFTLNVIAQEGQVNIMQALSGMWAQIGVTLQIQQMETGVYSQTIFGDPEQKQHQNVQAVFASWASSSLDPDQQLGPLYRTSSWAPGGANVGFYSNHVLDELLDQARAQLDETQRKALYARAQQIISDDAPHVLLYYSRDLAADRASLSGPWIFPGGEVRLSP